MACRWINCSYIYWHNIKTWLVGGLTAVIYTDTMQAVLMVGGGLTLMGFGKIWKYLSKFLFLTTMATPLFYSKFSIAKLSDRLNRHKQAY